MVHSELPPHICVLSMSTSVRSLFCVLVPQVVKAAGVSHAEVQSCLSELSVGFSLKQKMGAGERKESPSFLKTSGFGWFILKSAHVDDSFVRGGLANVSCGKLFIRRCSST